VAIPLVIPGAALVRLIWTLGGTTTAMNVLGASVSGAPTFGQTLANTLGAAIKAALSSSGHIGNIHSTTALTTVGVRDVRTANNTEFFDSGGSAVGTATGDPLPHSTALVITLRTARSGHSYLGRVYLPGFAESNNDTTASANSGAVTSGVAFLTAIQSALASNGLTLAVASRPAPQIDTTKVYHFSDGSTNTTNHVQHSRIGGVTNVTAIIGRNTIWDSQRRRGAPGKASTLLRAPVAASYSS
jgi:hypothetical protein